MPTVHLLNTKPGDCTIIEHLSGRRTMIDICDGNEGAGEKPRHDPVWQGRTGNFRMCLSSTNPIEYAKARGIGRVFRFILTHPDMDHMDGFDKFMDDLGTDNFWDSGSRRSKPDFEGGPYLEWDWDRYEKVRDGKEGGVTVMKVTESDRFPFANLEADRKTSGGDGLYILAPNDVLLADPDIEDDLNDGSYVILYRSAGGRILLPGDAHDNTWGHIGKRHSKAVRDCSFLLAPHHGRHSDRSYDFLDVVRPKLTLIGCAPSEHIDYDQWNRRRLPVITSSQCGNVVLEANNNVIDVYVQNVDFAISEGVHEHGRPFRDSNGYAFYTRIAATPE